MPRDGSGIYHRPVGTDAVTDTTIESTKYNVNVADVEQDLNQPRPIVSGGTGATSADGVLDNISAEKFKQVVVSWDSMVWRAGSFYAATTATGAAPVAGHAFAGIAYYANATDLVCEARDLTDPTSPTHYVRVMTSGVWGPWSGGSTAAASVGEYTFDSTLTFPPAAGQIRFNNATQNSTTEIFISHTTATGVDVTNTLPFSLRVGNDILVQDKDEVGKYKLFTATNSPVLSGADYRVTVAFKVAGIDLVSAQRMLVGVNNSTAPVTASIGPFTFDSTITFPPNSGQIRFNNATQNSTTEIFISHLTQTSSDITGLILSSIRSGYSIIIQDTDEPKYKVFTATANPVLSGGDYRITVTLKSAGTDLVSGQLMTIGVDSGTAVRYDVAQGLTLAQQKQARDNIGASTVTTAGYLVFNTATQIVFQPWMGDLIKINGVLYQIPGNITAANTGIYLNGTAGQNLAAFTHYYVYLFNNAGTLTIDYSTTAYATSATAGNVGMQIKTGDDTRTLIGLVFTNGSSQFIAENVISWFNKKQRQVTASTNISTNGNICQVEFSTWADEAVMFSMVARMQNAVAQGALILQCVIDGAGSGIQARNDAAGVGSQSSVTITGMRTLTFGRHTIAISQSTTGTPSSGWQETYAMFRG